MKQIPIKMSTLNNRNMLMATAISLTNESMLYAIKCFNSFSCEVNLVETPTKIEKQTAKQPKQITC